MSWETLKNKVQSKQDLEIDHIFASVFNQPNGKKVIEYLESLTVKSVVSPQSSSSMLWHLEGQRYLVNLIKLKINKGIKKDE
jgi:effector-binding domain-containing protein